MSMVAPRLWERPETHAFRSFRDDLHRAWGPLLSGAMPKDVAALAGGSSQSLAGHIRDTLALAVPVMLARAGIVVMLAVAIAMTGHAGADQLAHLALSFAPQIVMLTVGVGLLVGTVVLVAQADGAGRPAECGRIWRLALVIAFGLGLFCAAAMTQGETLFAMLGQEPGIGRGGAQALLMLGPGMPGMFLFVATSFFLEGIGRPRPGMVVSLGANVLNAALCWVLVYGAFGLPPMGAAGAALALSITRWAMFVALAAYVFAMPDARRYGATAPLAGHAGTLVKLLRLGAPLALAIGLETTAFANSVTFAGLLGAVPLAAIQIALNVSALVYMLSLGLSTATAVRVANAVGRGDPVGLRRAGWVGTGIVLAVMVVAGAAIALARWPIAALYTDDAAVLALTAGALAIVATYVIVDGAQGVLMGAMRGAADLVVPMLIYTIAFWGVGVPLAFLFGVRGGGGVPALLWSLAAALLLATLLLGARFHVIAARTVRPV